MDEEDIAVWRRVANPNATDFLRLALEDIEEFHATDDPAERKLLSREIVRHLLDSASAMAGDDVRDLAFGSCLPDEASPADHLMQLSERLRLVGTPFRFTGKPEYPYSISAISREIRYLSWGDPPKVLRPAPLKANKAAKRGEVEHWARALAWVEFLKIKSDTAGECKAFVAKAYGVSVDALAKWPKRVAEELGASATAQIDRAGRARGSEFRFKSEDDALKKLKEDGAEYKNYKGFPSSDSSIK